MGVLTRKTDAAAYVTSNTTSVSLMETCGHPTLSTVVSELPLEDKRALHQSMGWWEGEKN